MVIDMFKNKKKLTADFHDVISGDEWELDCSCHEFSYSFPVCNHTESVNEDNIGFIQGYMNYSVPFEAELFTNYMNEIVLGIVMPVLGEKEIPLGHCKGLQKSAANAKGNVLGMVSKVESWDNSVLTIGMVMDMEEEDINVCIAYVKFIKDMGLIEFTSNVENCSMFYYTDINGTELVKLLITLKHESELIATTPLSFRKFK